MPVGATVLFGEWGQYNDMFSGLCGLPGGTGSSATAPALCTADLPIGVVKQMVRPILASALVTGSEVQRWGIGVVQEIDSAAMHVFARWQHLDLDLDATDTRRTVTQVQRRSRLLGVVNKNFGKSLEHQLRRSRYLPNWWRDLLLNR